MASKVVETALHNSRLRGNEVRKIVNVLCVLIDLKQKNDTRNRIHRYEEAHDYSSIFFFLNAFAEHEGPFSWEIFRNDEIF